jgi:CRISPR/Cas system-associated protein Csm6
LIELPANIRDSAILTNENKDDLSRVEKIPSIEPSFDDETLKNIFQYYSLSPEEMDIEVHKYAAKLLTERKVNEAWQVLLTTGF